MQVDTLDRRRLSERDARAISELVVSIWPKPGRTADVLASEMISQWRSYDGPEAQHPRSFVVREGERVIAHASFDPRIIASGDHEITVLALARVCSDPAMRGRKLGQAVVKEAFKIVDQRTFPFSLFQTTNEVQPFYERFGAVRIYNRFINSMASDPKADPWWNPVIMRYPDGPGWPTGEIDLRGPGW
jgi:predicted GNAT family N-acyltransferase